MNWRKILSLGTVVSMIAVTGCSSNIPENNQGNRNGMRLTASAADMNRNNRTATKNTRSTWNVGRNSNSAYSNRNIDSRARNSVAKGYSDYDRNAYRRSTGTNNGTVYNRSNVNRSASAPVNRVNRASNAERLNRSTIGKGTAVAPRVTTAPRATYAPRATAVPKVNTVTPNTTARTRRSRVATIPKLRNNFRSNARLDNVNGRTIHNRKFDIARGNDRYASIQNVPDRFVNAPEETVLAMANTSQSVNIKKAELNKVIDSLENLRDGSVNKNTTVNRAKKATATQAPANSFRRVKKDSVRSHKNAIFTIELNKHKKPNANKSTTRTTRNSINKNNDLPRGATRYINGTTTVNDYRPSTYDITRTINKAVSSGNKVVIDGRSVPARSILNEALRMK